MADEVENLIEDLKTDCWWDRAFRSQAALRLGEIGDARAVESLIEALKDRYQPVRQEAAEALGKIGDARAVEPLIEALQDGDVCVCQNAANALGSIGDARVVEPLANLLWDANADVRETATEALVKIGRPSVAPLIKALDEREWIVRQAAAAALYRMRWVPSTEDERCAYLAAKRDWESLGRTGRTAVSHLVGLLGDADQDVRKSAAGVLGNIGDARAVVPLIGTCSDKCDEVRQAAAGALRNIGKQRSGHSKKKDAFILCGACFCRYTEHKAQGKSFKPFTYYACPEHHVSSSFDNVIRVVAVLDHAFDRPYTHDATTLLVNWYSHKRPFDFEEIRIRDASDFEMDELVMKLKNDMDDKRRKGYKSIPVFLSPQVRLSQAQMHMLKDTFGTVEKVE